MGYRQVITTGIFAGDKRRRDSRAYKCEWHLLLIFFLQEFADYLFHVLVLAVDGEI
jgi:hypothetical protein